MPHVYIGLGSNLGDRGAHLRAALTALSGCGRVLRTSRRYLSAPLGHLDQPTFLNQVAELETALPPRALLAALKALERELGREPGFRNGPRVIDLDILLYDDEIRHEPGLVVPHPRMLERAFVLRPLAELIGELQDRPMADWLAAVADQDAEPIEEGEDE